MDPELLSDKSQLVKCLTKAGLVVKVKEEKNLIKEDQDDNKLLRVSSLAVSVKVEGEERNKLEDMVDKENVSVV